jgi:hypothetical protein
MLPILFSSYDTGAPVLNNVAASMIAVLDGCLVTGYNPRGVVSMTVAANVCTVVTTTPHGYAVDQRVTHTGATAVALNGDCTVATVPSTTSYTFPVVTANVTDTTASMSAIRTPLGWAKEFSGTNKAVYKMLSLQSYGQRLRVVDDASVPTASRVMGVEGPTSVDLFTDKFPTEAQLAGGGYWAKGENTVAPKFWAIIGDDRFFYFICDSSGYVGVYTTDFSVQAFAFGDPISLKAGEAFGAVIFTGNTTSSLGTVLVGNNALGSAPAAGGDRIARQHTGLAKSIAISALHPSLGRSPGGANNPIYPSPIDNGMVFTEPSFIAEALTSFNHPIRAVLPGFVTLLSRGTDLPKVLGPNVITMTDGTGRKLVVFPKVYGQGGSLDCSLAIKISSDWRA